MNELRPLTVRAAQPRKKSPKSTTSPALLPATRPAISVVGLGYVGAVSMACLAHLGFRMVGIDISPIRVDAVRSGKSPIVEERSGGTADRRLPAQSDRRHPQSRHGRDGDRRDVRVGRHADGGRRQLRSDLRAPGQPRDRPCDPDEIVVSRRRHALLDPTGHHAWRRRGRNRGRIGPEARRRFRRLLQSGIPARRRGGRRLLRPAQDRDRRLRRARRGRGQRHLYRRRSQQHLHVDPGGRDGQVCRQRLACDQGGVRQRNRPRLQGPRHRQPRRHEHLRQGSEAEPVALLPQARLRLRRLVPAQGSARGQPSGRDDWGSRRRWSTA